MKRAPKTPPFDPINDLTSAQTDEVLYRYLHRRLGLKPALVRSLTLELGCDGASHEVWEELVARRRKAGR